MIRRELGNTGEKLSILGFGGILVKNEPQKEADRIVRHALDHGINYFDVAPSYGDAQDKLGPALRGSRNKIFLACKTAERTKIKAALELEDSLKKLETDHFDLYQFHGVKSVEEAEQIFAENGAMEAVLKAKRDGKLRFIGFSAHDETAAVAMINKYDFTSVLFPVNWVCMLKGSFGHRIMEKAVDKGVARLALKALAYTKKTQGTGKNYPKCWYTPTDDPGLAAIALRYTLSQPVTAAIPPGDFSFFDIALDAAENFKPVTEAEIAELRTLASDLDPIF
ncbi:MAG: aldo/keto reductase [Eubacteriales bacterium]|nr:aldo/keto reductase [Eubacteriales bacterium]